MQAQTISIADIKFEDFEVPEEKSETYRSLVDAAKVDRILHPITLTGKIPYKVIAGKMRLKATIAAGGTTIQAVVVQGSDFDLENLALDENLKRDNLSWHEISELIARKHELRIAEKGQRRAGRGSAPGWSIRDTSAELGYSSGYISESLMLSEALAANPQLKNVKDRQTALKLISTAKKRLQASENAMEPVSYTMNQIFLGDSSEVLKFVPSETFDVCITDPPWASYQKDESLTTDERTVPVFYEIHRVLKKDSFLYVFCGMEDYFTWHPLLAKVGFTLQIYPVIWHKTNSISQGRRGWEYGRDTEFIILGIKGSPVLVPSTEQSSILTYPQVHWQHKVHPHEKPIELIEKLLADCSYNGSSILDPFSGSGVVLEAAKRNGRRYLGVERDKKFYEQIVKRLENVK